MRDYDSEATASCIPSVVVPRTIDVSARTVSLRLITQILAPEVATPLSLKAKLL